MRLAGAEIDTTVAQFRVLAGKLALVLCLIAAMISCAIPGQKVRVSPPVMGVLQGVPADARDVELAYYVMHRENPKLFDVQRIGPSEDGSFYFEPVALMIAGQEYSKYYRIFLHYKEGGQDRVIWRGEYSRRDLAGRIQLDCVLDRRARVSQPCLVQDPLKHPWLVAQGGRTFRRLCATCHGEPGEADSTRAQGAPDLSRIAVRRGGRFDRMEIAEFIEGGTSPSEHGTREMPAWGERLRADNWRYSNADELAGATLDPVLAYLESLQRD